MNNLPPIYKKDLTSVARVLYNRRGSPKYIVVELLLAPARQKIDYDLLDKFGHTFPGNT